MHIWMVGLIDMSMSGEWKIPITAKDRFSAVGGTPALERL